MNSASAGHSSLDPRLCDPAAIELDSAPECPLVSAPAPDPEAWRREVAARLARYRTRRKPRAPRYPSLLLPFDARDNWSRPVAAAASTAYGSSDATNPLSFPQETAGAAHPIPSDDGGERWPEPREENEFEYQAQPQSGPPEASAKIIEFPRSAAIPIAQASPLADPIFDRPRIVEAPEIVPPAPALGGILMEPVQSDAADRSPRAESSIPAASIPRRLLATGFDAAILAAALSAFAAIFFHFNPIRGPLPWLAGVAGSLAVLLWMSYQFLFVVYLGSTPGLRAAGLQLTKFDGSPAARSSRRWRVLASFLSAISAGLGYLWCFLDQDSLCWHDRITRTHIQSAGPAR